MINIINKTIPIILLLVFTITNASNTKMNNQWVDIKNQIIANQKAINSIITNEDSYIKSFNPDDDDRFGWAVAVSGNTVVVGAYNEGSDSNGSNTSDGSNNTVTSGAVYVFVRGNNQWIQQAYIKPSHIDLEIEFGKSLAIDGDTLVVGSPGDRREVTGVNPPASNNNAGSSGAAYVFTRSGNTWTQQADIKPSNTKTGSRFGQSVAIDNNTIIVGADAESGDGSDPLDISLYRAGAAYIYTRTGNTWVEEAYLKASNPDAEDRFGWSVDISGDSVVIGAFGEASNASSQSNNLDGDSGAAYIFTRAGTSWTQQKYLKSLVNEADNRFGFSCAISGDQLMIASAYYDNISQINSGLVEVYQRTGTNWSHSQFISSPTGGLFGWSMDMDGSRAIVGARGATFNSSGVDENGAAFSYELQLGNWEFQESYSAFNPGLYDFFGYDVGISQTTIIAGSPLEDSNSTGTYPADFASGANNDDGSNIGAAYIYYYNDVIFANGFEN